MIPSFEVLIALYRCSRGGLRVTVYMLGFVHNNINNHVLHQATHQDHIQGYPSHSDTLIWLWLWFCNISMKPASRDSRPTEAERTRIFFYKCLGSTARAGTLSFDNVTVCLYKKQMGNECRHMKLVKVKKDGTMYDPGTLSLLWAVLIETEKLCHLAVSSFHLTYPLSSRHYLNEK